MLSEKINPVKIFTKSVVVRASAEAVWEMLTNPRQMENWLMDDKVKVTTGWKVGGAINIEVMEHWVLSESKGIVLRFEPYEILEYTHLSSLSRLPDEPASYCVLKFTLASLEDKTRLTLEINNFPTESIYKHMEFYWGATLEIIKKTIEEKN